MTKDPARRIEYLIQAGLALAKLRPRTFNYDVLYYPAEDRRELQFYAGMGRAKLVARLDNIGSVHEWTPEKFREMAEILGAQLALGAK